jgi:hypothetical protein
LVCKVKQFITVGYYSKLTAESDILLSTTNKIQLNHASGGSKQAWHVPDDVCTVLELLMMGGKTARNM